MKLPFIQFFTADYQRDTRALSLAAKGAWVDVLCLLHCSETRGTKTLKLQAWARVLGASEAETGEVITELAELNIADVKHSVTGEVTLSSRRMLRESITKGQTRLRVINHRRKAVCNAARNAKVTDNNSEFRIHNSEEIASLSPAPAPADAPFDEVPFELLPDGRSVEAEAQAPEAVMAPARAAIRPRNLILDALVAIDGSDPLQVTASAFRAAATALAEIRAVCPALTPDEIRRRSGHYRAHHRDLTLTPHALAKHWAKCDRPPLASASTDKRRAGFA